MTLIADAVYALTAADSVWECNNCARHYSRFYGTVCSGSPIRVLVDCVRFSRDNFAGISEYRFTGANATSLTCVEQF